MVNNRLSFSEWLDQESKTRDWDELIWPDCSLVSVMCLKETKSNKTYDITLPASIWEVTESFTEG